MSKSLYKNLPCGDDVPGEMGHSDAGTSGGDYGTPISDAALKRGFTKDAVRVPESPYLGNPDSVFPPL